MTILFQDLLTFNYFGSSGPLCVLYHLETSCHAFSCYAMVCSTLLLFAQTWKVHSSYSETSFPVQAKLG